MPELPDLHVYAENLRPKVCGKTIARVEVQHPRFLGRVEKADFMNRLKGALIANVARRGKTLRFLLGSGGRLDVHLMRTGEIYYAPVGKPARAPCPVLSLFFTDDSRLVFSDVHYDPRKPLAPKMRIALDKNDRIGIDPLDSTFTPGALAAIRGRSKIASLKAVLTDQKLIAGLGNAYADEILWEARLRPRHPASLLTPAEVAGLHRAIGSVVTGAITCVRDGLNGEVHGEVRDFLKIHHRGGRPCPRCGERIAQELLRDRATYWCPTCQV
jgi:formamidopyrimidine-DNA glycosylase